MRLTFNLIWIAAATLAGCSAPQHASLHDRAAVTAELISTKSACSAFSRQLASPSITEQLILGTYQAAKAAKCIRPDV